jgi:hypothetical protein
MGFFPVFFPIQFRPNKAIKGDADTFVTKSVNLGRSDHFLDTVNPLVVFGRFQVKNPFGLLNFVIGV